ncbi:AI-2E family transporter [cf. Phormidesmis sp. LEGE 11477]|uniref:AI-2E family transporter n=1 Tax=cf. Phormidesmis sp. LEGE 11477 TaxID=1828680 RepID=UPI001882F89D|nr:AI-2E family transporter [cf. Phormidesmis sp. LEGE 11477]
MKFGSLVGLVALLLGLYLLWSIRLVVLLAFTAITLATVLNRVVRSLVGKRLKRNFAIVLTLVALTFVLIAIFAVVAPPFANQVNQWLDQAPLEVAQISLWLNRIDDRIPIELAEQLQKLDTFIQDIPLIARSVFNNAFLLFRGTLAVLFNVLLVLVITIMLLVNPKAYRNAFVLLFPQFYRYRIVEILDHCERSLVGWGTGILFNIVVITILSFSGLAIIGVPLPIGNAFLAGLLTFIPNIGPVLSVIPPAILGLLEAPWKGAAVVALYIIIQQVESNFLTPMVMKRQVSLLPVIALTSQLVCGVLFGFLGLFLALPLTVIGQVWLQELVVKDIMNNWKRKTPIGRRIATAQKPSIPTE